MTLTAGRLLNFSVGAADRVCETGASPTGAAVLGVTQQSNVDQRACARYTERAQARCLHQWSLAVVTMLLTGMCTTATRAAAGIDEHPLGQFSGPRGGTLFTQLPPEQTKVSTTNDYGDPKMWNEFYHELEIGAIGSGVGIGDFDHDGRPDLFVANKVESCRLFRNLGDFKFEDITEKAGVKDTGRVDAGPWKQGVAVADVNNDGWLDVYVCRFNAPNLLYINQQDGTFKESAAAFGLDLTDATNMAAFCDYDRDGWLDVYIQTNLLNTSAKPQGQADYLYRNNGDGTFTNVSARAGISTMETQGHSAIWWDYDNDEWPDLYVANDFETPDFLYRNNQDGTFSNVIDRVVPHTPFSSMGSDLGDVNNDGLIDLFVGDMATTTHQKDHRTMVDARAVSKDLPDDSTMAPSYQRNALYLNTDTGRMLEAAFLAGLDATDWTWSVRFEDLDNDGRVDVHVTNGMYREINNADLLWKLMTAESPRERVRLVRSTPPLAEANLAYRNLGDLQFEDVSKTWGLDHKGVSFGAAFGDLDGDGDLDLVYTNYQASVTLLRNESDAGHRVMIALRGTTSNSHGVGASVRLESAAGTQVRQLSLARGYISTSEPVLHFGLGEDPAISRLEISWPSGHTQVFENLPVDRRYVITEPSGPAEKAKEQVVVAAQFEEIGKSANLAVQAREPVVDEIGQQRLLPTRFNRRGPAVAVGDIDGNGRDDILMGGTALEEARIMFGAEPGRFVEAKIPAAVTDSPVNDGPVLIFDADGDGKNDLLLTKGGNSQPAGAPQYQPRLFLNGEGGLRLADPAALPALTISAGAAVAADFNRDGRVDVFIGARLLPGMYPENPRSALLRNESGRFTDVTDAVALDLREIGMVTSALWTDVDGDGWLDLVVALDWGRVKYLHNVRGERLEDWTEHAGFSSAGTGWWQSLAAADFNGDGQLDYVLGNVGLNTQYHAETERPALMYYGQFKGEDSAPTIVEAHFEDDNTFPWRSRKDLNSAVPSIAQRFSRSDVFARATVGQIIGEEKLATAQRFAANELRSGVLLSQANGVFRFEALPRLAQIAPLQGIVTGDFDGDGKADIYAVQNSFAPAPVVGRFDGGLSQLLKGDGQGGFTPVAPATSGLIVPGDAKGLAVIDLDDDSWPDFFVTRNNNVSLAYRNRGTPDGQMLKVVLRGPAENPGAIGARIRVEHADGSSQMSEMHAGSGHMSQSSAGGFFGSTKSNPALRVEVRWPSGDVTQEAVASPSGTLVLNAPSR